MVKRIVVLVVLAGLVIFELRSHSDDSAEPSASPAPSEVARTVAPSASATPGTAAVQQVDTAIEGMTGRRSLQVHFVGTDAGGTLEFNVASDGTGNLSGSYVQSGLPADVIVINGKVYMRGAAAIASYTGVPVSPSLTGWVRLPSWSSAGVLGTVASPRMLYDCIRRAAGDSASYVLALPATINGTTARTFMRNDIQLGVPWTIAVTNQNPPQMVAWQFLTDTTQPEPAVCTGGGDVRGTPGQGVKGLFTFTSIANPEIVVAPPGWVDLPLPSWVPDPGLPPASPGQ